VLLILGVPFALAIWLIARAIQTSRRIEEISVRIGRLECELDELKKESRPAVEPRAPVTIKPVELPPAAVAPKPAEPSSAPLAGAIPVSPPPPIPATAAAQPRREPILASASELAAVPPPIVQAKPAPEPARPTLPAINWEQFMGVKLFAWVGGFALFLGVVFFVKYSFEHNLIPPEVRVAIGFVTGLGLLVGGVLLHRRQQFVVGAQALCATGVVILYAVTYACRSIYKFEFFGTIPTFLLMVLITTTAFFVAVRLNALVVAILGMLGGFLTPILISTARAVRLHCRARRWPARRCEASSLVLSCRVGRRWDGLDASGLGQ
jgi:uncharacterized membrane protein